MMSMTFYIKLYNIAGDYETVVTCLTQALGEVISQPDAGGEEGKSIEATAREISHHYSRLNRAAGKERDAIYMLLKIRDATNLKSAGRLEAALEVSPFSLTVASWSNLLLRLLTLLVSFHWKVTPLN